MFLALSQLGNPLPTSKKRVSNHGDIFDRTVAGVQEKADLDVVSALDGVFTVSSALRFLILQLTLVNMSTGCHHDCIVTPYSPRISPSSCSGLPWACSLTEDLSKRGSQTLDGRAENCSLTWVMNKETWPTLANTFNTWHTEPWILVKDYLQNQ